MVVFISDAIVQLAVDNTRNILYTRSEKGTIQVHSEKESTPFNKIEENLFQKQLFLFSTGALM